LKGFFVTGTDTEVGKTIVTSALAKCLNKKFQVGVYKPTQSGIEDMLESDGGLLWQAIDQRGSLEDVVTYSFKDPVAPLIAAQLAGVEIEWERIIANYQSLCAQCQVILVEGAGGFLVPIAPGKTIADLAQDVNLPVMIVARPNLGTVNHTLLTIEAIRKRGLEVAGIIINNWEEDNFGPTELTAPKLMEEYSGIPVIMKLPRVIGNNNGEIFNNLAQWMENEVDWERILKWL
jgi:dethiobiotin synthetase